MIIWTPGFARVFDSPSEILLEMLEPENVAVDEAPVERFLYQDFQVAHAERRNGALPADPDEILPLRLQVYKGVAEEPAYHWPIEFSPHSSQPKNLREDGHDQTFSYSDGGGVTGMFGCSLIR